MLAVGPAWLRARLFARRSVTSFGSRTLMRPALKRIICAINTSHARPLMIPFNTAIYIYSTYDYHRQLTGSRSGLLVSLYLYQRQKCPIMTYLMWKCGRSSTNSWVCIFMFECPLAVSIILSVMESHNAGLVYTRWFARTVSMLGRHK